MLKRRNGLILTMSSGSAIAPLGQLPVYGSTKRFVLHLSHSLQVKINITSKSNEFQNQFPLEKSGVKFHAFHPHFIQTKMTRELITTKNELLFPTTVSWINSAFRTIRSKSGESSGYLTHEGLVWIQVTGVFLAFCFRISKIKSQLTNQLS